MRKMLFTMAVSLFFCLIATAQIREISGIVIDEKGEPVPYASIIVKSVNKGVSADSKGAFKVKAKTGDILVISAVGFKTVEVGVTADNYLKINVSRAEGEMNEVLVTTALGIKRSRNQLPYSAQVITGDDVTRAKSPSFLNNLTGAAAGLDVRQSNTMGGSTNVVLRGNKSISGSNQALFVVDGVPYNNSASSTTNQRTGRGGYDYGSNAADINPDDIESITVLKGPAASALYGSLGYNGVILITTKKATKGLGVSVNAGVTFNSMDKSTFPEYQNKYGGGYGQYYEDASGFFLFRDVLGSGTKELVVPTSEDASYGAPFDATKKVYLWDAFDPTSPNFHKARPWVAAANGPAAFMQKSTSYNYSVFIDGSSDKGTFKLGYSRNDDKGILANSKLTKNAITLASTYRITDNLTAGANLNFTRTEGLGRYGTGYDDKNPMSSFRQWWQVNTDVLELRDAYERNKKNVTWNWADPDDLVPIYWDNPWFLRYQNYETDWRNRYFGNVSLNYKPLSWLNILGRVSLDQFDALLEERAAVGTVGISNYSRTNQNNRQINYDLMANVDKDLTKALNLKAVLGTNIRKDQVNSISASTNGGLVVPLFYSLSNSKNPINAPAEFLGKKEVQGIYAGATLTYMNMLTFDATIRRDASSTLPKGNNIYYYPSVSAGFVFSNLEAVKKLGVISYGKIRANYAYVGNDAPFFSTSNTYAAQTAFGSETMFAVPTTSANPDLKPEQNKSTEFGLEMNFLKNRVGFDFTIYDAKSYNQILPVSVSRATGFNAMYRNSGTVQNKGIELSINGTPIRNNDFAWSVVLNWSKNKSKVLELFDDGSGNKIDNIVLGSFQGGVTINATLDQPYGIIKGTDFVYYNDPNYVNRDPAMRIVGSNGRYQISTASNKTIGDPNPDWIGSLRNTFRYKNFSLGCLIDTRQGGDVFSLDLYYGLATGLYPETAGNNDLGNPLRSAISAGGGIIRPGVDATGKANTVRASAVNYGAYGYRYSPAAGFIYDASFVKLRELSLTYDFPKSVYSKLKMVKKIQFSLVGRNLWIISKNLPYADPEETYGSGNLQGYQGNSYPSTRTISANINIKF